MIGAAYEGAIVEQYPIRIRLNGVDRALHVPANRLLLDLLRDDLDLTGTKEWCSIGVCGACTVLRNGQPISSCLVLAVQADGAEIITVEGLASTGASGAVSLTPLQQAFIDHGGFQCGICTPGQLTAAEALLVAEGDPDEATIREWMGGNLCRCTGYAGIVRAIRAAAAARLDGVRDEVTR